MKLNHETTLKPSPNKVTLKGEGHRELIEHDAEPAGVLEIARKRREPPPLFTYGRKECARLSDSSVAIISFTLTGYGYSGAMFL